MRDAPWVVEPGGALRGTVQVPGDKSISHRAVLFGLLARGPSHLRGLSEGEDVRATLRAAVALGGSIDRGAAGLVLHPPTELREPDDVIDCGNSGTTLRLLAGLVAAAPIFVALTGDASLRRRPMARIADPLRSMGVRVDGRAAGARAPLTIRGPATERVAHDLAVASAQVLTCLLLAGRRTGVVVDVPGPCRDHTQRLLAAMGAGIEQVDGRVSLMPIQRLEPLDLEIPGDLSAAAFWLVAGSLIPGSDLLLRGVGVNPTRSGVLDALRAMGADIKVEPRVSGAEPIADLRVRHAPLRGCRIAGDLSLRALDELPVIAIAAAFAHGVTEIRDAAELRVKESDRIARVASGLRALGATVEELDDGLRIVGGAPRGPATIDATGDHRIAMAFAVAGAVAGPVAIGGARAVASSYPDFPSTLEALRAR